MSNTQTKLFSSPSLPLADQLELIERTLTKGCKSFHVSFGMFKGKRGNVDHNAMIVITDNAGQNFNASLNADSIVHLMDQVQDVLARLNKSSNTQINPL